MVPHRVILTVFIAPHHIPPMASFLVAVLCVACGVLHSPRCAAQARSSPDRLAEVGIPDITNFNTSVLGYDAANWVILRDRRGLLYVGNTDGVLTYDGEVWRLTPSPNYTPVFSMAEAADGTIHLGVNNAFGRIIRDSAGRDSIELLSDRLPENQRPVGRVRFTAVVGNTVWYATTTALYRWDGQNLQTFKAPSNLHSLRQVGDEFYTVVEGQGLFVIRDGTFTAIPGGESHTNPEALLSFVLPAGNGRSLVGIQHGGWFMHDGNTVRPAWTEATRSRLPKEITCGVLLADSTFAIGTVRRGIWIIDRDGRVRNVFDETRGIRDEYILHLYQDAERLLWAALDNGITMMHWPSQATRFGRVTGLRGRITSVIRFRDRIHACGTMGVFRLRDGDPDAAERENRQSRFELIPDLPHGGFAMLDVGSDLLVATSFGLYLHDGKRSRLISPNAARLLYPISASHDTILLGTEHGLALLRRRNDDWRWQSHLPEISDMVLSIDRDPDGSWWFGTYGSGVYRVEDRGGIPAGRVRQYDVPPGKDNLPVLISTTEGPVRLLSDAGSFIHDAVHDRLRPDTNAWKDLGYPSTWSLANLQSLPGGGLWMQLHHRWRSHAITERDRSGKVSRRMLGFMNNQIVHTVYPEDDGVIWFGGEEYLFRHDRRLPLVPPVVGRTLIRAVFRDEETVLYWGGTPSAHARLVLPYSDTGVRIRFFAPTFRQPEFTEYRWKLAGQQDRWSEWERKTTAEYPALSEGSYTFHVEARTVSGEYCKSASINIRVTPPWQRTWWAYAGYFVIAIGVFVIALRVRTRNLEQRGRQLERTIRERTQEIRAQAEKIRSQAEELETLDSIVRTVNKEVRLTDVLSALLQQTLLLFPHVNTALYLQRHGENGTFRLVATVGEPCEAIASRTFTLSEIMDDASNSLRTIQDGVYVLRGLERYYNEDEPSLTARRKAFMGMSDMQPEGMRGFLVLGSDRQHTFDAEDLRRLLRLREHVSSAVAKALAIRELEEKNDLLDQSNRQLREMQAQLIVHEKLAALGELTAGIAHEIQNPLNFVNNFSSLSLELLDELEQDISAMMHAESDALLGLIATVRGNCERIREHGMRATSIVRAMLMHTRKGGGRRELVTLNEFLDQFVLLSYHGMRMLHPEHDLRLHTNYDRRVAGVRILPQEMSRVIVNICNNAWEAAIERATTTQGGASPEVQVRSEDGDDRIRIVIRDNGPGIPPSIHARIFEPFFTTKRSGTNAGLGLSMSYEIVTQLHKGKLLVESVEGEYSEFVIEIPIEDEHAAEE